MRKSEIDRLKTNAEKALSFFHRIKRDRDEIWTTRDYKPQWVQDMCFEAHGGARGMLPDDYRYEFVVEALRALEECDDPDEIEMPEEIYAAHLTHWLASRLDRVGYCDDAAEEYGADFKDTFTLLTLGYAAEQREVLGLVRGFLENLDEEDAGEESAEA